MTVSCPSCGTRYRLPPRSRLDARATFRCTRCDHVFDPAAGAEGPAVEDDAEAPPVTTWEMTTPDDDDAPPPAPRRRRRVRQEPADDAGDAEASPAGASAARFALRSMLVVALGYAVLSIWLYTHPQRVAELLAGIPIIGPPMSEARLSPANIQLADVRGEYHRLQGDVLVFAVSGIALNNAPVPVSGVQIQCTVHGDVEQRQTVFAGAAPRALQDLTVREVDLLQTLVPSKDWSLPPGEQTSFLVVFKEPPVPLEEFSAEVVAVRRGGRPAA